MKRIWLRMWEWWEGFLVNHGWVPTEEVGTTRQQARRLAREEIPRDVEMVLTAFAEFGGIPLWKMRVLWNATPEYRRPGVFEGLCEAVRELKEGRITVVARGEDGR